MVLVYMPMVCPDTQKFGHISQLQPVETKLLLYRVFWPAKTGLTKVEILGRGGGASALQKQEQQQQQKILLTSTTAHALFGGQWILRATKNIIIVTTNLAWVSCRGREEKA
jgi:hypothetical protein